MKAYTNLAAFAIIALLMGGSLSQVQATSVPLVSQSNQFSDSNSNTVQVTADEYEDSYDPSLERLQMLADRLPTLEQANSQMGRDVKTALLWDYAGLNMVTIKYSNGYFVGQVHTVGSSEVKDVWGIYGKEKWAGFYDEKGIDNMFYGKILNTPEIGIYDGWTINNVDGKFMWGYGLNLFK